MRRYLAPLLTVIMTAAACTTGTPPPGTATTAPAGSPAGGKPVQGGRVVVPSVGEIQMLNPLLSAAGVEHAVWELIYGTLVGVDPETGDATPALAETFSQSDDGLTVTFELRKGLRWSDGEPFTGEDYRYTVEALARAKTGVRGRLFSALAGYKEYGQGQTDSISGIDVSDDGQTVKLTLTGPFCRAIEGMGGAGGGILPRHRFLEGWDNRTTDKSATIDDHPLNLKPPAAMGPFAFKEHRPGVEVVLEANENYYLGRPNIDEYIVKQYSNTAAVKAALLSGELSMASLPSTDINEVQATNKALEFHAVDSGLSLTRLTWNHRAAKAPWLGVKEVRQALWYGLDVQEIIDHVLLGYGTPVYSHLAPASWAYTEEGLNKYPYGVDKAKQLLEQAGATMGPDGVYRWVDGTPMHMRINTVSGNQVAEDTLQIIQEQYRQIGISIEPVFLSVGAYFETNNAKNLDREGTIGGWTRGPDPDSWHFHGSDGAPFNWFNYANPDVDKALDAGRFGPDCSQKARTEHYQLIDRQINEDAIGIFLYVPQVTVFTDSSIKGLEVHPFAVPSVIGHRSTNIHEWWIEQD